jgi:hypothetical protein
VKSILYNISSKKSEYVLGDNTIKTRLYSVYSNYSSGVESVGANKSVTVIPAGKSILVSASCVDVVTVEVYDLAGAVQYSKVVEVNGGRAVLTPALGNGLYIVKVTGAGESAVCKIVL